MHSATTKYVNFISGVYRLADWCVSGQDMILPRLALLKQEMTNLIERLANEHFGASSSNTQTTASANQSVNQSSQAAAASVSTESSNATTGNQAKMPLVFIINNLYFIVTQLQVLNL